MDTTRLFDQTFTGETLALGHSEWVTWVHNCTFIDCDITLMHAASSYSIDAVFRGCTIRARRPQVNHSFPTSDFVGCKFFGKWIGCEFGALRRTKKGWFTWDRAGTIADCDLTESVLDTVEFGNCDVSTLLLPKWPHFTILEPAATAVRLPRGIDDELDILIDVMLSNTGPLSRALVLNATLFLKQSGLVESDLFELMSRTEGVLV